MLLWMRTRLPALVAMGALVVLAAVVARGSSAVPVGESKPLFGWLRWPSFRTSAVGEVEPRGTVSDFDGGWAAVLGWAILLLPVGALVFVIIAVVVMSVRARKPEMPSPVVRGEPDPALQGDRVLAIAQAARAAQRVLEEHQGGPPGDAVIAAWLELERVAARSGSGKQAHQTPTEFTEILGSEHAAITKALTELRSLYHRARFGRPGEVGPEQAEAARRALDEITASLMVTR